MKSRTATLSFFVFSILFIESNAHASEPGFRAGNRFEAVQLSGEVQVVCTQSDPAFPPVQFHTCFSDTLSPSEFDRFVGSVDADSVELTATHEGGSSRTKTARFNAKKGESAQINLWVSTLFQRPLLKSGTNRIQYRFTRDSKTIQSGELSVQVARGGERRCKPRVYFSDAVGSCNNGAVICERYFRDENYCN